MNRSLFLCLLLGAASAFADAIPAENTSQLSQQVLARYFAAVNEQTEKTRGVEMDMDFSASLPKLKKEGSMLAKRIVSSLGKISFMVKSFTGDNTVKNYVIIKYMSGEVEMAEKAASAGITPKNYKFKYKRQEIFNGRTVHIFELNPRKKQVGLFKGELWVDDETALPVRETGSLVKSPSIFLKKVNFTRTYGMYNGAALPARVESTVETRIAGKAELDIRYSNFAPESGQPAAPAQQPAP
ncbi:MAG TPA: hypothetical protein VFQ91_27785 [Bryobacteraceae bacterium]|nr:hypothetical protein [Bryobacteraceae bacterium]